jgi:hypothetical protein
MFAKFDPHIQVAAIDRLRIEHLKWMPQPGEVYAVCNRLQAEEFDRRRWDRLVSEQLEDRRRADQLGLPCQRPMAIADPAPAPPPPRPDVEDDARRSQVCAVYAEWGAGKLTDAEAERRIDAITRAA